MLRITGIGGLIHRYWAMPRGRKPKVYPENLVHAVRLLYEAGATQSEIAADLEISQKVVWKLMLRHDIPRRARIKRDQTGPANHAWKGDSAGYQAVHLRVQSLRGKPSHCEECGTREAKRFEWANMTGNYEDPFDYRRMCSSCHHRRDGHVLNLGIHAMRKEVRP